LKSAQDKRVLHTLRKQVDALLDVGAVITSTDPLTIVTAGETLTMKHGTLVGYSQILDLIEPVADHEWPEALRQMAIDFCIKQLDQAIEALNNGTAPAETQLAANDSAIIG